MSELLEEIEISLRLDVRKFFSFVENLKKENADNPLVQQLCYNLMSTHGECDNVYLSTASTDPDVARNIKVLKDQFVATL